MSQPDALVRRAVETLPSEVAILDSDGIIRFTNEAWTDFAIDGGFPGDPAMLGEDYLAACRQARDDEYAREACTGLEAVFAGEARTVEVEYPCPGPGDAARWFLQRASRFTHDGSEFVVVEHLDITDRREAQQALETRTAVLEDVASTISHDLRNPLSAANAWAEILEDGGEEKATRIRTAIDRANDIIDDALVLARETEATDLEPTSIEAVAADAWELVDAPETTLVVDATDRILADQSLLQTIFENLFRNAVDHAGPDVAIEIGPQPNIGDGGGMYIADDGPGVPSEVRGSLFDSGFSTADSSGIGLAIVDRIVDAHGWEVDVHNDGGAVFEVSFEGETAVTPQVNG